MKKILPVFLLLLVCLTGCSSDSDGNVVIKYSNGVYTYKGKAMVTDEYKGYEANITTPDAIGGTYSMTMDSAKDVTNLSVNFQQVLEENMDKYKDCYYYAEYLGTQVTMAQPIGNDQWRVIQGHTASDMSTAMPKLLYEYLTTTPLTNGSVTVQYDGFKLSSEFDTIIVRKDCALITGIIKVSEGTYDTTDTVSIVQGKKEIQLQHGASQKYDYYVYNGMLIQILKGMDLSTYIQFN